MTDEMELTPEEIEAIGIDMDEDELDEEELEAIAKDMGDTLEEGEPLVPEDFGDEDPVYNYIIDTLFTVVEGNQQIASAFDQWLDIAEEASVRLPYEVRITVMQNAREGADVGQWVTGQLVLGAIDGAPHGEQTKILEDFARDTGYSVQTLRGLSDVAKFWPPKTLKALLEKDEGKILSWSHFDRARRGLELADAEALLEQALDNTWSVRNLEAARLSTQGKGGITDSLRNKVQFAIRALLSLQKEDASLSPTMLKNINTLVRDLEDLDANL